jgi:ribosomal protein S18 acetylase RimI-like enzyme
VAELDSKIIGYELSTYSHFSAHLARLAVLPQNQFHGIGYYLAREMIRYFYRHGTLHISVNTQDDNQKSLNLYKRLGFSLTGERFPVFEIIAMT